MQSLSGESAKVITLGGSPEKMKPDSTPTIGTTRTSTESPSSNPLMP